MDTTAGASRRFTGVMCGSCPGGTIENSPAFQGWVKTQRGPSPERTAEILNSSIGDPTVVTARQEPRPTGRARLLPSRDHSSDCIRPGATGCRRGVSAIDDSAARIQRLGAHAAATISKNAPVQSRSAGFLVCGFWGLSSPQFIPGNGAGKHREPAGSKACATGGGHAFIPGTLVRGRRRISPSANWLARGPCSRR